MRVRVPRLSSPLACLGDMKYTVRTGRPCAYPCTTRPQLPVSLATLLAENQFFSSTILRSAT